MYWLDRHLRSSDAYFKENVRFMELIPQSRTKPKPILAQTFTLTPCVFSLCFLDF